VGIRKDIFSEEFYFPDPKYSYFNQDLFLEMDTNIGEWYRRIHKVDDVKYEVGKYYLRERGKFSQTNMIHVGLYREMFIVDSLGLRKFTHNELAALKGLNNYDFDSCSNKQRMYMKISYASNCHVVKSIAESIKKYFGAKDTSDNEYVTKEIVKKIKTKKEKSSKVNTKDILLPKHKIISIHIDNLKGIKNLNVSINKNLTAIMGVNGCGKSTILHALACMYSPYKNGDDYKFSFFFTPNPDSTWKNSKLSMTYYDENAQKEITREYKKDVDRWSPRYENRPKRDVFFIGIESCIPEIEIEKQTSFIDYSTKAANDDLSHKIIETAADILNKNYKSLTYHKTKKKELVGVLTTDSITYSSLSMGAGEQRIIKILKLVYTVNQYSLILIDEIDLLLHVTALKRLLVKLSEIATKRNLQILFTTHSLEMNVLKDYVDIRYLENLEEKTIVYNSINTDMIYELSDHVAKPLEIFVEDILSETIVKRIAEDLNILSSIKVTKYGVANNAFVLASSFVLKGEDCKNILIILDGDVYVTLDEKEKCIKKILSGTEREHDDKVLYAASIIKEFNLPNGLAPEEFIYGMLIEMDEDNEVIRAAKKIKAVSNSHQWLDRLVERMGHSEEMMLHDIIDIVSDNSRWENYVKAIRQWMIDKREELKL
jgi:AAA15 family ATPase/GTPase